MTVETKKIVGLSSGSVKTSSDTNTDTNTKASCCEDSVLTLRCSNRMDYSRNNITEVVEENEDDQLGSEKFCRRTLVGTMKSALTFSASKLQRKDKESRIDDSEVEHDENRQQCESRDESAPSNYESFSLSIEDFMLEPSNQMKQSNTAKEFNTNAKATLRNKKDKIKKFFKSKKDKNKIDMEIGIKLALPDKIDVMRGLEVPRSSTTSSTSETDYNTDFDVFSSSQKKLMVLPDKSCNVLTRSISSIQSPFKMKKQRHVSNPTKSASMEVPKKHRHVSDPLLIQTRGSNLTEEVILRSSELEPSVHQTTIPTANEVLIHARVCALMEGYDQLLEARAKAGKKWFNFGDLVGISRLDLTNIYLSATGQNPVIPAYVGQDNNQPPPLPHAAGTIPVQPCTIGNPFDTNYPKDFASFNSLANSSESPNSPKKESQANMKSTKPHPSIIKSLLECADDIVVEDYFNETIGEDSGHMTDAAVATSNVQVTIFSSQRQREFIVCFRVSMLQHAKPFQKKLTPTADENGVISDFSKVYNEAGLEEKLFQSLNALTTENPFCDICFCAHSFAGNVATIAAVKCAELHPMMTIKCHMFGSPKMGLPSFRQRAHSLPNLRIFAIEFGSDYYVNQPHEACWTNVGHSIVVSRMSGFASKKNISPRKERVVAQAFKFGKNKTQQARMKKYQMKADHDMRVYLHAIESFTHLGCQWMKNFEGEDGQGILSSTDNEERLVV